MNLYQCVFVNFCIMPCVTSRLQTCAELENNIKSYTAEGGGNSPANAPRAKLPYCYTLTPKQRQCSATLVDKATQLAVAVTYGLDASEASITASESPNTKFEHGAVWGFRMG